MSVRMMEEDEGVRRQGCEWERENLSCIIESVKLAGISCCDVMTI